MVTAGEIRDDASLRAWLEGRSREDAIAISQRAVCRLLPQWGQLQAESWSSRFGVTALPALRAALTIGVLKISSDPRLADAIRSLDFIDAGDAAAPAGPTAFSADNASYAMTNVGRALLEGVNLDQLVDAIARGRPHEEPLPDRLTEQIREDAILLAKGEALFKRPLWSIETPEWFRLADSRMRTVWQADGSATWSFWLRWWDGVLSGKQLPWDLQEKVALIGRPVWHDDKTWDDDKTWADQPIWGDTAIWDKGAAAVATEIERIELEFAVDVSPNAEVIVVNDEGRYEAVTRSNLPARTLQDARGRIADTIQSIREAEAQNQYVALRSEADLLQGTLDRYGDNPLRLHEVCFKVVRHVGTHLANGVLPEGDNLVGDVADDLQNTADDIYNFDNEVRRTVDVRAKLRFDRLGEAEKTQVRQLALAVADRSVPALADELREDAKAVLAEAASDADTAISRYRLGSRLARVVALGGKMFKDVIDALGLLGNVGGGISYFMAIVWFLLGTLS